MPPDNPGTCKKAQAAQVALEEAQAAQAQAAHDAIAEPDLDLDVE